LTTKRADPSSEISKLRAALPVLTVLINLLASRSQAATLPEMLSVTYKVFSSGERTIARGFEPTGMKVLEKSC